MSGRDRKGGASIDPASEDPGAAAPVTGEGTAFGAALSDLLWDYRKRQTDLSREMGTSASYVNALATGKKAAAAPTVDRIADALGAKPQDRVRLHRAAARDAGFKLDLPEGF
jgi:DNA-binding Xre family transcriptional regulator